MVELMESCGETTKSKLRMVLELESVPFTQNGHYFQECRDKWLSKYKDARAGKGPAERVTPMMRLQQMTELASHLLLRTFTLIISSTHT